MGILDREWYADHQRKQVSKANAEKTEPQKQQKPISAHWTIQLMVWIAALTIGTAIARWLR